MLSFKLLNHRMGLNKAKRKLDSISQYTKTQPKLDVIRLDHFITFNSYCLCGPLLRKYVHNASFPTKKFIFWLPHKLKNYIVSEKKEKTIVLSLTNFKVKFIIEKFLPSNTSQKMN